MKHDLLITLDKERQIPFSRQIYEQVRNAIHSGALSGGTPCLRLELWPISLEYPEAWSFNPMSYYRQKGIWR